MAVPPKLPMLSLVPPVVAPAIVPGDGGVSRLPGLRKPPAFDLAPRPVPSRRPAVKRAKPRPKLVSAAQGINLSPRVELRLVTEWEDEE